MFQILTLKTNYLQQRHLINFILWDDYKPLVVTKKLLLTHFWILNQFISEEGCDHLVMCAMGGGWTKGIGHVLFTHCFWAKGINPLPVKIMMAKALLFLATISEPLHRQLSRKFSSAMRSTFLILALPKNVCLVAQSCLTLCNPTDCSPPGSIHGDSPGKNTGMGCHSFLPTQGSSPGLPHCRWISTVWATREAKNKSNQKFLGSHNSYHLLSSEQKAERQKEKEFREGRE